MRCSIGGYTPPIEKRWQAGEETVKKLYDTNRITFETGEPMLKYYKNEEKEIFEDIISLIHCFAMKMYSKRRKSKLKMIEENLEVEQNI